MHHTIIMHRTNMCGVYPEDLYMQTSPEIRFIIMIIFDYYPVEFYRVTYARLKGLNHIEQSV